MDNAKVLILCWLRSMILKIDAATFYVHMTKHSQISRKISFKIDYNCHHNIFTVRCNYVVLVVLAQVVIIIVSTISYLYISLFIYLSILFNLLFLALTLLSHIDWYELEIILWIVCTFFLFVFFLQFCRHEIKYSNSNSNKNWKYHNISSVYCAIRMWNKWLFTNVYL